MCLDFIGIERESVKKLKLVDKTRFNLAIDKNINHLRISRILASLHTLGFSEDA